MATPEDLESAVREVARLQGQLDLIRSALGHFMYSLFHDLKTPSRVLVGYCQLGMRKDLPDVEHHELWTNASQPAREIDRLVNGGSRYGRLLSSTDSPRKTTVDVIQLLHSLSTSVQTREAKLLISWVDDIPAVIANKDDVETILQELLNNAATFCVNSPHVHVSWFEEPKGYMTISAHDNG